VFVRCMSICMSVRSGPVNQTSLKWFKLWTSNFSKGGVARFTLPPNFSALSAYSCETVKATDIKFDVHVSTI